MSKRNFYSETKGVTFKQQQQHDDRSHTRPSWVKINSKLQHVKNQACHVANGVSPIMGNMTPPLSLSLSPSLSFGAFVLPFFVASVASFRWT
jgi:hypothetical protein